MKFFSIALIFIYTLVFSIIGAVLIALSLRLDSLDSAMNMIKIASHADNFRISLASAGFLLILVNILIAQLSLGKLQRHKTIAFENQYGQVTVSLAAIEDYIRKLTHRMPEIKEMRSAISAVKSGIEVTSSAVLYADANIPEVTEKIQNAVRIRLQEMLGVEETVTVKIHVAKISQREKETKGKNKPDEQDHGGFKGEIEYGKGERGL